MRGVNHLLPAVGDLPTVCHPPMKARDSGGKAEVTRAHIDGTRAASRDDDPRAATKQETLSGENAQKQPSP